MMAFRSLLVLSYLAGQRLDADISRHPQLGAGGASTQSPWLAQSSQASIEFYLLCLVILSGGLFALVATAGAVPRQLA
jgi:hypothetical protein